MRGSCLAGCGVRRAASLRSALEPRRSFHGSPISSRRVATQEGLLAALPRPAGRVLFAGAEGARRLLVDELGAHFVPLYRTKELRPAAFPDADLVVLASASAARAYAALELPAPVVSIGPQTTAQAERLGLQVAAEAETHDAGGLVEAVRRIVPPR